MHTNKLIGPALDWAVAKCEGVDYMSAHKNGFAVEYFSYSTNWAHGGPIVEREKIGFWAYTLDEEGNENPGWYSETFEGFVNCGATPLIAAMRCYVASKLGDDIEIPEELA